MKGQINEWISCYIFHDTSFELVLKELVHPLIQNLKEQNKLASFFFIRYWEEGPHIRLRILPKSENDVTVIKDTIEENVQHFFITLPAVKYNLQFNNYVRENERYGGQQGILFAEEQFMISSSYILNILEEKEEWNYGQSMSEALKLHMVMLHTFFDGEIKRIQEFLNFLLQNWIPHSVKKVNGKIVTLEVQKLLGFYTNSYNNQKSVIDQLTSAICNEQYDDPSLKQWNIYHDKLKSEISKLIKNNNMQIPSWVQYGDQYDIDKENQILWPWLDSLIHMTNNRLGIHLRDEAFLAFLMQKSHLTL